jgi:uncharacterized membrane protein YhaH (DUF805 family)
MMSTANPYQPPRAAVEDVKGRSSGQYQPVKMWSSQGRIGRLRYLGNLMGGYLVMGLAAGVLGTLAGPRGGGALSLLVVIPYLVFSVLKIIQRSHDMDWSGWSAFLAFIPLVGLVWTFKAGSTGENRYGAPPPPNTTGVKVLALVLPIVAVIGILAAVALPQYAKYTQRAKALQQQQQQQTQPTP